MYMLIPMNLIILGNYVYVDSTGFLNACKLCICWFQWFLILRKYVMLILLGFINVWTMYMLILLFWMLVNYVYADSTGFLNACKLCICCPMDFIILVNYVYVEWMLKLCVDFTGFWMIVNYVCWYNWGLIYL